MRHLPASRCADRAGRNGAAQTFFPRRAAVPREPRNSAPRRPPLTLRAVGCGAGSLPAFDTHRGRDGAVRQQKEGQDMARIGSFKKVSGEYRGQITTFSVQSKSVRITPEESPNGNAPSHRVFVGDAEVGAAWSKKTQDDRPYLSVKLDDPSFTGPVFAQLFEGEGDEYDLVWNRQPRRGD
jgi:uncharacterized protein (DUF736 family)